MQFVILMVHWFCDCTIILKALRRQNFVRSKYENGYAVQKIPDGICTVFACACIQNEYDYISFSSFSHQLNRTDMSSRPLILFCSYLRI